MQRRRLKGQKVKNYSVVLAQGEIDLISDEAQKEGISKSAVFRKMIEYYFGEDYQAFMDRASERNQAQRTDTVSVEKPDAPEPEAVTTQ